MADMGWRLAAMGIGMLFAAACGPAFYGLFRRIGQTRTNYRGETIPTSAGVVLAAAVAALYLGSLTLRVAGGGELAPVAVALGFSLLGFLDDRWGTAEFKGLRGHFRALLRGRVTTGLVKAIGGLGIASAAASILRDGVSVAAATLVIAMCANAFNLLDLRPLRALKVYWLASLAMLAALPLSYATLLGATVCYAQEERRRRVMLGDAGSNLLGSAVGVTAVLALPDFALWALAALLAVFHLWAEKHSLTGWIAARPWATAVDNWGVERTDLSDHPPINREESSDGDASTTHG